MLVRQIYSDFIRYHQEHNKEKTVKFYRQGLKWFFANYGDRDWSELERLDIKETLYCSWHKDDGEPLSDATHRRNKVALNQLQKHALDQGFIDAELLTAKDLRKPGSGRREVLPTAEDLDRLIAAASAALALALRGLRACGMRPGELCRADIEMVETDDDTGGRALVIREHKTARKTGRPRVIAIGRALGAVIEEARGERESGPIWRDEKGERWTPDRLGDRFRRLRKRLGLPAGLTLYCVRHYVGTWVARNSDIRVAKEVLGHSSITMTQRYAHGDASDQLRGQALAEPPAKEE